MKHYIIPYVAVIGANWTSIDIYNSDKVETSARIQVQRYSTGTISNTIDIVIGPRLHYSLPIHEITQDLNEPEGRATLLITCSDKVMITGANNWGALIVPREVDGFE